VVDRLCDWTRHFRCAKVLRDGSPQFPGWYDLSRMTAIEPGPAPIPRPVVVVEDRPRPTPTDDRRKLIDRAEKYVQRIDPPTHGTGTCGKATFQVALHLKGFALDEDIALDILERWAVIPGHTWKPGELQRMVTNAFKSSETERGFHPTGDRPARESVVSLPEELRPSGGARPA